LCFAREDNKIIHLIYTPRLSDAAMTPGRADSPPSATQWTQDAGGISANGISDPRLAIIDDYNRDVARHKPRLDSGIKQAKLHVLDAETEAGLDSGLSRLLGAFLCADALAVRCRDMKLLALRALSILGLLLVLSFLLYDEMESDLMLFVYGALILCAVVVYALSSKKDYHGRYIGYRALAEALRVQFYWALAGLRDSVCGCYSFTQKADLDFVRYFMLSICADAEPNGAKPSGAEPSGAEPSGAEPNKSVPSGAPPQADARRDCAGRFWADGQRAYHAASATRKGAQDRRNKAIARSMFALSIALFAVVAVMELCFKTATEAAPPIHAALRGLLMMHDGQIVLWRGILKIALGAVSAGTAFLANYYGGLSLPQQIFDNRRMHLLFGGAAAQSGAATPSGDASAHRGGAADAIAPKGGAPPSDERLLMLGRESAIESGGWYIAQKENAPGLFIS
jgi:hypothetical protein